MSNTMRYRPYYTDYSAHVLRHFISREQAPDPTPLEELSECSRQDMIAAEKAIFEMNDNQRFIINECYSPVTSISMFKIQFDGACEKLGIENNAGWAELSEALYRVAWHRGLIGVPYKKYEHLYERQEEA